MCRAEVYESGREFWNLVCQVYQSRNLDFNPRVWWPFKCHLGLISDTMCLMLPDNSDSSMEDRQRAKIAVRKL